MRLRFKETIDRPDPAWRPEGPEAGACDWCGFACIGETTAYVEKEPLRPDRVLHACKTCLAARHAGRTDPTMRIIWCPEIPQPALSHLWRTIALSKVYLTQWEIPTGANPYAVDPRLPAEFAARGDALEKAFADALDADVATGMGLLPADVRDAILPGLRTMCIGFPKASVDRWRNDESSFNGFTPQALRANSWYARTIGAVAAFASPSPERRHSDHGLKARTVRR